MGKKSKQKGSSYELKIAKMLSKWWGGGDFHRVPASGGLHWGSDQRVAGDIIPPQGSDFPFVVECKKREEWTMDHVLLDIGQPRTWWEQVVSDARRVKLHPILIFSRNRAKDFVMLPYSEQAYRVLTEIEGATDVMITPTSFDNIRGEKQVFKVIVTTYDTFTSVPVETIKSLVYTNTEWDPYADQYQDDE